MQAAYPAPLLPARRRILRERRRSESRIAAGARFSGLLVAARPPGCQRAASIDSSEPRDAAKVALDVSHAALEDPLDCQARQAAVRKGERFAQPRIAQAGVMKYLAHHAQVRAPLTLLPGERSVAPRGAQDLQRDPVVIALVVRPQARDEPSRAPRRATRGAVPAHPSRRCSVHRRWPGWPRRCSPWSRSDVALRPR